jgi:hypothetical protein
MINILQVVMHSREEMLSVCIRVNIELLKASHVLSHVYYRNNNYTHIFRVTFTE